MCVCVCVFGGGRSKWLFRVACAEPMPSPWIILCELGTRDRRILGKDNRGTGRCGDLLPTMRRQQIGQAAVAL